MSQDKFENQLSGSNTMTENDKNLSMSDNGDKVETKDPLMSEWVRVAEALRQNIGDTAYRSWIRPLIFLGVDGMSLQIGTPTRFMKDWVQSHYADQILSLWDMNVSKAHSIDFILHDVQPKQNAQKADRLESDRDETAARLTNNGSSELISNQNIYQTELNPQELESLSSPLDPRFTFDRFVLGKSNELACAAAKRITETDSVSFNPLYIYGGVGLGKTHLMHAIAWRIRERQPERKVLYLSAEKFMYQFIRALRFRNAVTFKEQFRSVDVLMIDDIQFISGKDSTQEEFFHTFNALIDQNKQIIISADKSPGELEGIQERLKSRLGWGLVADIHPTNYELRLGILKAKADLLGANMPPKVLEFLAQKISSNVRELEGALNRIIAHAELVGRSITIDYAQDVLQDLLRSNNRKISIDEIQRKVCENYGLRMADMQSARRSRNIARPRQVAMYLAKQLTSRSLPEIGRKFGGRDHTTVMHAVRKIEELSNEDPSFGDEVSLIRRSIMDRGE